MTPDLSVIITARNEMFLARTVEEVLTKSRGNTEVIVICDGNWPDPTIPDSERVTILYHHQSVGQRAAVNEGARLSRAKFIMKLDAHCALDEGFDVKLMADCQYDWTVVPRLYNLHAFDWKCNRCGNRWYQGPTPTACQPDEKTKQKPCDNTTDFERVMVWQPRWNRKTDFMRFDSDLHFQYWGDFGKRPEAQGDIAPTMSLLGACFFMHRQRYWDLGGSDEEHGSWGQQGTEIACKSWLSGGKLMVNKKTWYSHMFRTQGGDFGFPYPLSGSAVQKARQRSRDLWQGNKWPKAIHDLNWLIRKFAPVPGWPEANEAVKTPTTPYTGISKGIIYYTDNQLNLRIAHAVQKRLNKMSLPIVSASLKPMAFGKNIHLPLKRGYLTMAKQILAALEASTADVIFFCEHDVLYHPSHFEFTPLKKDVYYYNTNVYKVRSSDGHALHYDCQQLSGLSAYRETLLTHFKERVRRLEEVYLRGNEHEINRQVRAIGFEPGTHNRQERIDDLKAESWQSPFPNIDIRHDSNQTPSRWSKEQFRDQRHTQGWVEADEVPGWGVTKGRFAEILSA